MNKEEQIRVNTKLNSIFNYCGAILAIGCGLFLMVMGISSPLQVNKNFFIPAGIIIIALGVLVFLIAKKLARYLAIFRGWFADQNIPKGVKIIFSVYQVIAEILFWGVVFFFVNHFDSSWTWIHWVFAIIFMAIGVFMFVICIGLWKRKKWARIIVIILSMIGTIFFVYSIKYQVTGSIVFILMNGAIAGYLLFNKKAKKYFKK